MDFRFITAGELAPQQFVTVAGFKPYEEEIVTPIGEKQSITKEDKNPWIKGVPFQILNVKLPLVMVYNIADTPNIPRVVFYDTRQVDFVEIDQDYVISYKMAMNPIKTQGGPSNPINEAEGPQQFLLPFTSDGGDGDGGDDDDDDDPKLIFV